MYERGQRLAKAFVDAIPRQKARLYHRMAAVP
jgi:hypothetical protein